MSTPYKAECYDRWTGITEALACFKLDPSLRIRGLDLRVTISHITGLYVRIEYKTENQWVVTIHQTGIFGADVGTTFEEAYQLATTRFLGLHLQREARERKELLFKRAIESGLVKDQDWVSMCADGRVRICGTYQKAQELDGHQPGWCCRQYLASRTI